MRTAAVIALATLASACLEVPRPADGDGDGGQDGANRRCGDGDMRAGVEECDDENLDDGEVGDVRAGRLVDPNEGIGPDADKDLIGEDVGIDGAAASAEEAAVHIVPDAYS